MTEPLTTGLLAALAPSTVLVEASTSRQIDASALAQRVVEAATGLRRLGLADGDVLAVLAPQSIDWYVLHLAAAQVGVLTVPLNTRYSGPEITGMLAASGASAVAVVPDFLGRDFRQLVLDAIATGTTQVRTVIEVAEVSPLTPSGWVEMSALSGAAEPTAGHTETPNQTGLVAFGTSGTTSAPKLAVHGGPGVLEHCSDVVARLGLGSQDVVMCLLPPSGAYGYTLATAALVAGSRLVLVDAFRPDDLADLVEAHSGSVIAVTESILRAVLAHPPAATRLGSLRLVLSAGSTLGDVARLLDDHGIALSNVYGASEMLALTAVRDLALPPERRAEPGGTLVPASLRVRVVEEGGTRPLPVGAEGELQLSGPTAFTGYLGNPAATAEAFTDDGWYRTKDRARLDGVREFTYLSRTADTMRIKGYLVDPAQVEDALMGHPGVTEAQVVGIPDAASGEDRAVAYVVLDDTAPSEDALVMWCRARLAGYKVPAHFLVVANIPTTPSANGDKALKRVLRERAIEILEVSPR